jgi:hypothetical protein
MVPPPHPHHPLYLSVARKVVTEILSKPRWNAASQWRTAPQAELKLPIAGEDWQSRLDVIEGLVTQLAVLAEKDPTLDVGRLRDGSGYDAFRIQGWRIYSAGLYDSVKQNQPAAGVELWLRCWESIASARNYLHLVRVAEEAGENIYDVVDRLAHKGREYFQLKIRVNGIQPESLSHQIQQRWAWQRVANEIEALELRAVEPLPVATDELPATNRTGADATRHLIAEELVFRLLRLRARGALDNLDLVLILLTAFPPPESLVSVSPTGRYSQHREVSELLNSCVQAADVVGFLEDTLGLDRPSAERSASILTKALSGIHQPVTEIRVRQRTHRALQKLRPPDQQVCYNWFGCRAESLCAAAFEKLAFMDWLSCIGLGRDFEVLADPPSR